jgi:hypothetical protein
MKIKTIAAAAALAVTALGASAANAAYVFVGSWEVDQGPSWFGSPPDGPLAYTGQEAAALLYGGNPTDYVISTVDNQASDIDFQAWYSIIGYYDFNRPDGGGTKFAQNYSSKYLGQFYGPTSGYPFGDVNAAASSFVNDNASGATFTNYAFRVTDGGVPEPAAWALMITGFGLAGATLRFRRQVLA